MQKNEVAQVVKIAIAKQAEMEVYPEEVFEDVWIMQKGKKKRTEIFLGMFEKGRNYKRRLKELRRSRALEILDETYANLKKENHNAHKN